MSLSQICWLFLAILLVCPALPAASVDEPLAVIVPQAATVRTLNQEDLAAIYRRRRRYWEGSNPIEPVNLPASDTRRRLFSHLVLGRYPEEMEDYWNEQYFHGITPPYVVDSVEAVLRFVEKTPGAIGYVPLCNADRRVVTVLILKSNGDTGGATDLSACKK